MKYRVIAYDKNGHEVGHWDMNNEDRAKDLKREKERQGYRCEIRRV